MALGLANLEKMLNQAGGTTSKGLIRIMMTAELAPLFESDAAWAELCEFAIGVDERHGIADDYRQEFRRGESPKSAIEDNDIVGAIAACSLKLHYGLPVVAWAASSKHSFPGYAEAGISELATMRLLQWARADVSMPAETSLMTALHYMASTKHGAGSDPRAVLWLLGHGASVTAKNSNGDTPMTYLCGTSVWGKAQREVFLALLRAGSDPREPSNDGTTALDLLRLVQARVPDPMRAALIAALDADIQSVRPGFFSRLVGASKPMAWSAAFAH